MPIDLGILATTIVTTFLIPYAKLGIQKIAEAMAEKIGENAADHATGITKKIWDRVKTAFSSEEEKSALVQFAKRPEAAKALVEAILKEKFEQNDMLVRELAELVNAPGPNGISACVQITNAGIVGILDARGANFSGAKNVTLTGVMIGKPASDLSNSSTQKS